MDADAGGQSIVISLNDEAQDLPEMDEESSQMLFSLSLMCTLVMVIMCMAGVVGNSLSLFIFTRPSFRKRSINVLLAALSASDLCLCLLAIPVFSISQLQALVPSLSKLVAANVLIFAYPVTLMLQSMSVWMLVTITIDRYLAVCHPFTVRIYCTTTRALITIGLIVLFAVGYNFVRFWEWTLNTETDGAQVDEVIQPLLRGDRMFMLLYQNIATLITQFFIPLLVLCILNLEVARAILRAGETRRELVASEKREHSTAKMMLFVVIVFIFCYTLSFILNLAEILDEDLFRQPIGYLLNDVNNILVVINSSSSFIFYTKYSSRYRGQLRTMFIIRHIAARWDCCFLPHHMRRADGTAEYTTITGISGKVSYYEKKGRNNL